MKWLIGLALVLSSCAPNKIYQRSAFVDQILKPRKGFDGYLTNSNCTKREKGECVHLDIAKYDMSSSSFRQMANDLDFVCLIGNKRYKICLYNDGFCRRTFRRRWFKRRLKSEKFISIKEYDFLIKAKTRCFNKKKYQTLLYGS